MKERLTRRETLERKQDYCRKEVRQQCIGGSTGEEEVSQEKTQEDTEERTQEEALEEKEIWRKVLNEKCMEESGGRLIEERYWRGKTDGGIRGKLCGWRHCKKDSRLEVLEASLAGGNAGGKILRQLLLKGRNRVT